jgi:hypothetical protein
MQVLSQNFVDLITCDRSDFCGPLMWCLPLIWIKVRCFFHLMGHGFDFFSSYMELITVYFICMYLWSLLLHGCICMPSARCGHSLLRPSGDNEAHLMQTKYRVTKSSIGVGAAPAFDPWVGRLPSILTASCPLGLCCLPDQYHYKHSSKTLR